MITSDQLKDVLDRADKLFHYLKIDQKQVEWEEVDQLDDTQRGAGGFGSTGK